MKAMAVQINDKVKSKNKKGIRQETGIVIGLYQAQFYLENMINPTNAAAAKALWTKKYPDWEQKPLVLVLFDEPKRSATLQEWISSAIDKGIYPKEAEGTYEKDCPIVTMTIMPYDDLEVVNQLPIEILDEMSAEDFRKQLRDIGIITKSGKLTKKYRKSKDEK